jgi:hypothetical protein
MNPNRREWVRGSIDADARVYLRCQVRRSGLAIWTMSEIRISQPIVRIAPFPQLAIVFPKKVGSKMTVVEEVIPDALQPEVEAALAWFNQRESVAFEVTGILDPQIALEASGSRELRLILCGGDRCEQKSFRVTKSDSGYEVAAADDDPASAIGGPSEGQVEAQLDPPPGARREWIDRVLAQHAFVVLVFYRGFW